MTERDKSYDHRFRKGIIFAKLCLECASPKSAPQHFGEHTGPVVPVPGFAAKAMMPRKRAK